MNAIRRFLARECERNEFAIKRLIQHLDTARTAVDVGRNIRLETSTNGMHRLVQYNADGNCASSPISPIHTAILEKYLFEVTTLDDGLFELMEMALESLLEAAFIRESLIEHVYADTEHLEGFCEWGLEVLDQAIDPVRELYLRCTGEPLAQGRVR